MVAPSYLQEATKEAYKSALWDRLRSPKFWKDAAVNFCVDTSSSLMFYFPFYTLTDHFVVGLSWPEVLRNRAAALQAYVLFSRVQGKYLDLWRRNWDADYRMYHKPESQKTWKRRGKEFIIDTTASLTFKAVYVPYLKYMGNISWGQAAGVVAFSMGWSLVAGRPYGKFRDHIREKCGLVSYQEQKTQETLAAT